MVLAAMGWMVVDGVESALKALEGLPELIRAKCRKRFDERLSGTRVANDYLSTNVSSKASLKTLTLTDGVSVG